VPKALPTTPTESTRWRAVFRPKDSWDDRVARPAGRDSTQQDHHAATWRHAPALAAAGAPSRSLRQEDRGLREAVNTARTVRPSASVTVWTDAEDRQVPPARRATALAGYSSLGASAHRRGSDDGRELSTVSGSDARHENCSPCHDPDCGGVVPLHDMGLCIRSCALNETDVWFSQERAIIDGSIWTHDFIALIIAAGMIQASPIPKRGCPAAT
jgi:hypothetical protein